MRPGRRDFFVVEKIPRVSSLASFPLYRKKAQPLSRVNALIFHLAIADLFVTFLLIPLEVSAYMRVRRKPFLPNNETAKTFMK
jgi:hypothetical protein